MLIFLSQDVVFIETKHDLSVDYVNRQLGGVASKLTYDINEWVGERLFFLQRHQDTSHSHF